ncbi:MAG: triphosphoribosyl-dephospho-CoA synthase CitG [Oscillospiraceae bacterium]|nr:triphosphoribosyl-dephospho-CoA synthase CitG [Oscillospiraceae bacterium]
MNCREVTLMEVLDNREARVRRQNALLARFGKPLICFTMNIPGPVKNSALIRAGFAIGCRDLTGLLGNAHIPLLHREELDAVTGCEGFFVTDGTPEAVKALCVSLEEGTPLGRLFDLDVLTPEGRKLDRSSPRKCLICGQSARICGPTRAHSADALQARAREILEEGVFSDRSQAIGSLAVKSLLYEVSVTPKPGLVDRDNAGAHRDMDFYSFLSSAAALQPFFARCARIGMDTRTLPPEETFVRLRLPGRLAEQTMLRATGGINTHKGAIFSLGLVCGAAGRLIFQDSCPEALLAHCAQMARGLTARELSGVTEDTSRTAGERLFHSFGITGIRGQAEAGFPAVLEWGLPTLEEGLSRGLSPDRAGAGALLRLICAAEDTNLIKRGGLIRLPEIQARLTALLEQEPFPDRERLEALDQWFTRENLSPGGSADLLALSFFLVFLKHSP